MANQKKRKGLGSLGVDILLSAPVETTAPEQQKPESDLSYIPIDLIDRSPYQPRMTIPEDALNELAESIRSQGLIQPVVVRKVIDGRYELIAGERRWRASQLVGLHEIPAVIKQADDHAAAAMALVENLQRENLNPIEEAYAVANLIQKFSWTHQEVAEAIGKARATVSNLLRLLELSPDVRELIKDDQLSMGHARALLALPLAQQLAAAESVTTNNLSVRQTEQLVKKLLDGSSSKLKATTSVKDPNLQNLENNLADTLGAAVVIKNSAKNKGRIEIHYNSLDELDGILRKIGSHE